MLLYYSAGKNEWKSKGNCLGSGSSIYNICNLVKSSVFFQEYIKWISYGERYNCILLLQFLNDLKQCCSLSSLQVTSGSILQPPS